MFHPTHQALLQFLRTTLTSTQDISQAREDALDLLLLVKEHDMLIEQNGGEIPCVALQMPLVDAKLLVTPSLFKEI